MNALKPLKRVAVVALLAVVVASLALPTAAFAAKGTPYDYKIRIWAGAHGTIAGESQVEYEVPYGSEFSLDDVQVDVDDDSKYYVRGFRESGADALALHAKTFNATEDLDLVVAYGVPGEMVSYTLNYVEYQTGTVLAEPKTYTGKQGDKPVAAYEYIEGYRPLYMNITGTLGADGTNNWTFEYVSLTEEEQEQAASSASEETTADSEQAPDGATAAAPAEGMDAGDPTAATDDAATDGADESQAAATSDEGTNSEESSSAAAPSDQSSRASDEGRSASAPAASANAQADEQANAPAANAAAQPAAAQAPAAAPADAAAAAAAAAVAPATEEILDMDNPLASSIEDDANPLAKLFSFSSDASAVPTTAITIGAAVVLIVALALLFKRRKKNDQADQAAQ